MGKLRRALSDIPNVEFDGRFRYGWRAVRKIMAGEVFQLIPAARKTTANGEITDHWEPAYLDLAGKTHVIGRAATAQILAASVSHMPSSWRDVARDHGASPDGRLAQGVLEHLLATGKLTVEDLVDAADVVDPQQPA